jgi:hypothetical protein
MYFRSLTKFDCRLRKFFSLKIDDLKGALDSVPPFHAQYLKGIVSKLTIKFWMCQKCGKMRDYNQKMTTSAAE